MAMDTTHRWKGFETMVSSSGNAQLTVYFWLVSDSWTRKGSSSARRGKGGSVTVLHLMLSASSHHFKLSDADSCSAFLGIDY